MSRSMGDGDLHDVVDYALDILPERLLGCRGLGPRAEGLDHRCRVCWSHCELVDQRSYAFRVLVRSVTNNEGDYPSEQGVISVVPCLSL